MGAEPSPAPSRPPLRHLNSLTGIRALAALYVFVAHYADMTDIIFPLARNGAIGVNVFFCLSGFIMAYTTKNPPAGWYWQFYLRRLARIMPAYWVSLLVCIPILEFNLSSPLATTPFEAFMSFIGIQTWFRPQTFPWNPVGWSVQTELCFYLLFPLLYRYRALLVRFWYLPILYITFGITFVILYDDPLTETMLYRLPWIRVAEFACGIIAHELRHKVNFTLWPWFIAFVGACIGISFSVNGVMACAHGALTIPICIGLVQMANDDESGKVTVINSFLGHKNMVFLGEISYSFYLLHDSWRMLAAKIGYFPYPGPCIGPCLSLPYLCYSLVGATVLHVFVEMPFYTWAVRYMKIRAAARATLPVYVAPDASKDILAKGGDSSTAIIVIEPIPTSQPKALEMKNLMDTNQSESHNSASSEKEGRSNSASSYDSISTSPPAIDTTASPITVTSDVASPSERTQN